MATTTRLSLLQDIARALGGHQGSISSGTATTAVLSTLVGNKPDDELNDDLLVMPDAANTSDVERLVADFTGSTGTATWAGNRTDTTYTSETFFTIPRGTWTLDDLRAAINYCLGNTKRTYRQIVPSRDDQLQIALADLTWLRDAQDINVYWSPCPGLLHNADFTYWQSGTTSAPDGWTLAGSGATVARSTTYAEFGPYTVALTRSGADATLTYTVPYQLAAQLINDGATIALKVRGQATVANRMRVGLSDGNDTTWSSYHSGAPAPGASLTASRTLTSLATTIQIVLSVDTGNTTGYFDLACAVEGSSVPDDFFNSGGKGYRLQPGHAQVWNDGPVPVLASDITRSRGGQWVIASSRPYATLSSDSASTEADSDLVVAGTLVQLALQNKRGMDKAYLDRLYTTWGPVYSRLASRLIDRPPKEPQSPVYAVRGT